MFGFLWASLIEKKMMPVEVDPTSCMRIRSSASGCTRCQDICPAKGITITEDAHDMGECLKCGLCTAVCPTEALSLKGYSLPELLQSVMGVSSKEGEVLLSCGRAGASTASSSAYLLPCLGLLPWEAWGWLLTHAHRVTVLLPDGACAHCEFTAGEGLWRQAIRMAEEWTGKQIDFKEGMLEPEHPVVADVYRRQFLTNLLREMKSVPLEIMSEWAKGAALSARDDQWEDEPVGTALQEMERLKKGFIDRANGRGKKKAGVRRELLHRLIQEGSIKEVEPEEETPASFSLPAIDGSCEACGACSHLCPTGALKQVESEESVELLLIPSACLSCGLCAEVCWERKIAMQKVSAKELTANSYTLHTSHLANGQ